MAILDMTLSSSVSVTSEACQKSNEMIYEDWLFRGLSQTKLRVRDLTIRRQSKQNRTHNARLYNNMYEKFEIFELSMVGWPSGYGAVFRK